MSAIFGIWHLNGKLVEKNHLKEMKESLIKYGRDAQDIYIDDNIGFGSCINKISSAYQTEVPIHISEAQETILISDAQIYNRDELIEVYNLTDNKLISNNELLMKAYEKWLKEFPKYINGDFAIAIWKKENKELRIIRDHLGVRPLYYFYDGSTFAFATDYRAILSLPFIDVQINEVLLYRLISNNVILEAEDTYFKDVKKLKQSNLLKIDKTGLSGYKYWTPGAGKKIEYETEKEYFEALYNVVYEAIRRRIHSMNCEFGAQMSGGLDSSVITILVNRELLELNKELTLFSWSPSFEEVEKQPRDERTFIEAVCNQEGLKCLYYDINKAINNKGLDKKLPIEAMNMSPLYQEIESMTSKGVRCIFTGWGGDQGISHRTNLFGLFVNRYWSYFFKEAYGLSKGSILRFGKIIISNTILQLFRLFNVFGNLEKRNINISNKDFNKKMKKFNKKNILYFNIDPVKHIESGNIQTRTEMSAFIGAEYNVQYVFPFLDYNVVDFAMSIPRHMYYKNGINRYAYRKAFEGILPKELCYYIYKDEVARPLASKNRINKYKEKEEVEDNLDRKIFSQYIDFNKVKKLLNDTNDDDKFRMKLRIKRSLQICYNIQKLLTYLNKSVE